MKTIDEIPTTTIIPTIILEKCSLCVGGLAIKLFSPDWVEMLLLF